MHGYLQVRSIWRSTLGAGMHHASLQMSLQRGFGRLTNWEAKAGIALMRSGTVNPWYV